MSRPHMKPGGPVTFHVLAVLNGSRAPLDARTVAEATGLPRTRVLTALRRLHVSGDVIRLGRGSRGGRGDLGSPYTYLIASSYLVTGPSLVTSPHGPQNPPPGPYPVPGTPTPR